MPNKNLFIQLLIFSTIFLSQILVGCITNPSIATKNALPAQAKESTLPPTELLSTPTQVLPTMTSTPLSEMPFFNEGCTPPCIMGIVPGQTNWESALAIMDDLLLEYTFVEAPDGSQGAVVSFGMEAGGNTSWVTLGISEEDGIVQSINTYGYGNLYTHKLSQLVPLIGPPDEIWVHAVSDVELPVGLFFIWSDEGIFVQYSGEAIFQEGLIEACLTRGPILNVWFPVEKLSFSEYWLAKNPEQANDPLTFLELPEALGTDAGDFFQLLTNSSEEICIETPREIWPARVSGP